MGRPLKVPRWIYYLVGVAAFGMLYAISEWGWDFLTSPFLFLLGMAALSYGILLVAPLAADYFKLRDSDQELRLPLPGVAVFARGLSFVLGGLLLAAGAFIRLLDIWEPVWAYLMGHPGWLLGMAGIGLVLVSTQGLFKPKQGSPGWGQLLSLLPRRILAVMGLLLALGLIGLGLLELLWRPGYNSVVRWLLDFLPHIPSYEELLAPVSG